MALDPTQPGITNFSSARAIGRLQRFVAGLVAPAILLIMAPPILVCTQWFGHGSGEQWVPVLDYPYQIRGMNADVVVFGDSAAVNGFSPSLFQRDTGMTAVVLSNNSHSMAVMGDSPLDSYLQHNRRPKLIVIYLAPWDTGPPERTAWPEGLTMLFRHGGAAHIARYISQHPVESLGGDISMVPLVLKRIGQRSIESHIAQAVHAARGYTPAVDTGADSPLDCKLSVDHTLRQQDGLFSQQLLLRWRSAADNIALYLAPIPDCDGAAAFTGLKLNPPPINSVLLLPPGDFIADDFQVHIRPEKLEQSTRLLEQALGIGWKNQ